MLGDFKRFTSKAIVGVIKENPKESRRKQFLEVFKFEATKSSNVNHYQFWRHDNMPIELWSNKTIIQKINYVHQNPVKEGLVDREEDYKYSSAKDYAGCDGLLPEVLVIKQLCHAMQSRGSFG